MSTTLILNKYNNYVTDDEAQINFGSKYDIITKHDNFPDGPPTKISAINVMNPGGSEELTLNLDRLTYVTTLKGGVRNPDSFHHCYTNKHQTFHVYVVDDRFTEDQIARAQAAGFTVDAAEIGVKVDENGEVQFSRSMGLVIVSVNGCGNEWMFVEYCDRGNSVLYAVQNLPNCIAHDILKSLFQAYRSGHSNAERATAKEYKQAFVDGRLKKRKNRGESTYKVFIEQPSVDTNPVVIKVGAPSAFD